MSGISFMTATEDPNAPTEQPQFIVVTATPDTAAGQPVTIANPTAIQAASGGIVSVQVQPTDCRRCPSYSHSRNSPDRQRARGPDPDAQS